MVQCHCHTYAVHSTYQYESRADVEVPGDRVLSLWANMERSHEEAAESMIMTVLRSAAVNSKCEVDAVVQTYQGNVLYESESWSIGVAWGWNGGLFWKKREGHERRCNGAEGHVGRV